MEEIVKHINDTNASYRAIDAGDAKNTDLFLDNEHYDLFKDAGEQITVRFNKENLQKAILFIASILPRKYDNSATHKTIRFSTEFVFDQLAFLDAVFTIDGVKVETRTQVWNARKDVPKKNGETDHRFYFNGLLEDVQYTGFSGENKTGKFTIRNYVAGSYSDLHIKKASDGIFDVWITNTQTPYYEGKDKHYDNNHSLPLQQIFYGAPGTGKSFEIKKETKGKKVIRTTFHPDSDYSTFVGAYKPTSREIPVRDVTGKVIIENGEKVTENRIVYEFVEQAFLQAYTKAWFAYANKADGEEAEEQYLVIEEINRGNCAQIFGDLFQLLDRNDLGFSDYPITADKDMKKQLARAFMGITINDAERINNIYDMDVVSKVLSGEILLLPDNLYIWATMNTSDQSLFPIDSAFKRRWDWKYIPIKEGMENGMRLGWVIKTRNKKYDWWQFVEKINSEIDEQTKSEDKKLGYFFCKAENREISAETFVSKVMFYLWNDVFKDQTFATDIFADGDEVLTFKKFYDTNSAGKTIVREDKVELFLQNLGVEGIENDSISSNEINDYEDNSPFQVKYNGEFVEGKKAIDVFAKTIERIGVERVATMGFTVGGHPLLSKNKLDEDVYGGYGKNQRIIGDYWMIVKYNNPQKKGFLNKIKEKFGLDIEVV